MITLRTISLFLAFMALNQAIEAVITEQLVLNSAQIQQLIQNTRSPERSPKRRKIEKSSSQPETNLNVFTLQQPVQITSEPKKQRGISRASLEHPEEELESEKSNLVTKHNDDEEDGIIKYGVPKAKERILKIISGEQNQKALCLSLESEDENELTINPFDFTQTDQEPEFLTQPNEFLQKSKKGILVIDFKKAVQDAKAETNGNNSSPEANLSDQAAEILQRTKNTKRKLNF